MQGEGSQALPAALSIHVKVVLPISIYWQKKLPISILPISHKSSQRALCHCPLSSQANPEPAQWRYPKAAENQPRAPPIGN